MSFPNRLDINHFVPFDLFSKAVSVAQWEQKLTAFVLDLYQHLCHRGRGPA